jgi:hypothetical protein
MALTKSRRKALGVGYRGVATLWRTDVGNVIVVAESLGALQEVSQRIKPADFDPTLCPDVVVFQKTDTEEV